MTEIEIKRRKKKNKIEKRNREGYHGKYVGFQRNGVAWNGKCIWGKREETAKEKKTSWQNRENR